MRSIFIGFFFLTLGFAACTNSEQKISKEAVVTESKHSADFNQSVQSAMDAYYGLTEAFVNWDSVKASSLAAALSTKLDSLSLDDLKKEAPADATKAEASIASAKKDLSGMVAAKDITTKRHAFNSLSDNLFQFLNTVKYDRQKLYLQECPMAFNDADPGHWLSANEAIRNPYLGLHHPRYKGAMIECGETKEVVNYTGTK
jgi:hypothetical protein